MADTPDDITAIGQQLRDAEVTGPDNIGNEELGNLTPNIDDPFANYAQGVQQDPLDMARDEGQILHENEVTLDDKSVSPEIQPDHGLDP